METSMEYCWNQRWRCLWIWIDCLFMMNEALEGQPFFLRIIQSWSDSILLSILNDFKLEDTFENQLISQRQLYFLETSCVSEEFRLHLRWWMKNIYKHFNKVFNIISKMCWTDGISKSIGEYNVFYTSDIEGMSKFILDVNFSMYVKREMNVMSKGGVEVCHPYGVATWHWCDKHSLSLQ